MKLQTFMLHACNPSTTSLFCLPSFSAKWDDRNGNLASNIIHLSLVRSRKLLNTQYFDVPLFKCHRIQPCCSTSLCESFGEEPFDHLEKYLAQSSILLSLDGQEIDERYRNNKGCYATSDVCLAKSKYGKKDSFMPSECESLEPRMLGIKPEPPCWPEREAILWTSIEQKAKSFGLPLSLRMIKKKHQWEAGFKDLSRSNSCSVKKAFSSMVYIIVELQTYALHMREALCHEDLDMIIGKVQKEMYASFVWLFQQVFSRTPALMVYVMILLANFSVCSTSHNAAIAKPLLESVYDHETVFETTSIGGRYNQVHMQVNYPHVVPQELSKLVDQELRSDEELGLWDSIEDEALHMQGLRDAGLDHEIMLRFVSPLSVEIEQDTNTEYFKTDLLYQMALSSEPFNTLLLCNYAQFLQVTAQDYNRAEECFKRAVQVEPPDAEVLNQYANFLWTVKNDLWEAEERYQQALAAEPRNSYYASSYANFLWSTGGEETCYPPSNTSFNNIKSEEV